MKLTPYKGLSSEPIIRYLYTGREYNIETGDYYYRARIYDQSVGRFGGKDAAVCNGGNAYFYVANKSPNKLDPTGNQLEPAQGYWDFSEAPKRVQDYVSEWDNNARCSGYFKTICGMTPSQIYDEVQINIRNMYNPSLYNEKPEDKDPWGRRLGHYQWGTKNIDLFLFWKNNIGYTVEQSDYQMRKTLIHELFHYCQYKSGFGNLSKGDLEMLNDAEFMCE